MQLDTVTIRCSHFADMRRLRRAGGAVWEGRQGQNGRAAYWLVRLPAVVALRLGLIGLGVELPEVTEREPERCHVKRTG